MAMISGAWGDVNGFMPAMLTEHGVYGGTYAIVSDDPNGGPSSGGAGVTISRTKCEATEVR